MDSSPSELRSHVHGKQRRHMSDPVTPWIHAVGSAALCGLLLNHAVSELTGKNKKQPSRGRNGVKRTAASPVRWAACGKGHTTSCG